MTPAPRKGMDARERAKRIDAFISGNSREHFIEYVAEEIEAAVAEERERGLHQRVIVAQSEVDRHVQKARREALEEAAGVVGRGHKCDYVFDCPCCASVAAIRALSNQEPKTSGEKPATEREGL